MRKLVKRRFAWVRAQLPNHKPETVYSEEGWAVCPCGKYGFESASMAAKDAEIARLRTEMRAALRWCESFLVIAPEILIPALRDGLRAVLAEPEESP